MKIMIEVSGGTICNVTATEEISIYLVDHDSLKQGDNPEDAREAMQPDCICSDDDFQDKINEALSDYEEKKVGETANARAIAAVPDLVDALQGMYEVFGMEVGCEDMESVKKARRVLAYVRGDE